MTNWDYYESIQRFQRILEAEGISDALKKVLDFEFVKPRITITQSL